jgi:hypothetical protein
VIVLETNGRHQGDSAPKILSAVGDGADAGRLLVSPRLSMLGLSTWPLEQRASPPGARDWISLAPTMGGRGAARRQGAHL